MRRALTLKQGIRPFSLRATTAEKSVVETLKSVIFPPATPPVPAVPSFPAEQLLPSALTRMSTLPNGIRVVTERNHGETATVGVWIDTGSRYESADNNGTAHFLEHMAFKGTKNRSHYELERQVENMGASLNAYTSREHTVYFAKVFKNDVKFAVSLLADILQNPLLDPEAIERERDVITREMEEVDLQHSELVFDKLHQMAFRGSSLGRSIIGPEENVLNLNRDHLSQFIRTHYTGNRMVLVGTGAVDHDALCKLAGEHFGSVSGEAVPTVNDGGRPYFIGSDVRMREDEMDETYFALAFEGLPWSHADQLTLSVMVSLLGVYDKSLPTAADSGAKLARMVGKDNLASSVMPFNTPYKDTGLFGVYCVAPPESLGELSWQVQEEITRLCFEVDEDDVRRAINQTKANVVHGLDGTQSSFEDIGRQILTLGRRVSTREIFHRLDAITPADIQRVANTLFYDRDLAVAAIGPVQKLPDYLRMRRRTYWLRY